MSKKNYNINLQDSSYYISLNITKKKQQQHQQQQQQNQLANGFFKPARSTTPNKTFFKTSTSSTTKSPYDESLTRKKDTNEKNLRERLKLVNEISNLNSRKHPQYHHHNLFTQNPKPSQPTNSHATLRNKTEFEKRQLPTRSSTIYTSKPNKNYKTNLNLNLKTNYKLSPNNKFNIEIASPVNKSNCFLFEKPKHSPYTYYSHTPNPTKNNNSNHYPKESLFFKRSISATDDYDVYERYANIINKNNKKSSQVTSINPSHMKQQQHQYMSSFSFEKPSCIGEEETITLTKDLSMSTLSRSDTLTLNSSRTVSSFDLDKLSVNKFLMLDSRKGNTKSSEISKLLFSKPTVKRRDSLKPLNSVNETSQMSSIRSMGSNELDLYIDSLIRKFRLRSNLANTSTAATMTSSAEAGSSVNTNSNKSTNNDVDSSQLNSEQQQQPQSKQIYINNPTINENQAEEEEEEENDDDGDGEEDSTFINYTHSYELEDLNDDTQQMNLADEDLSFDNENTSN